jgi:dienelactone hydrolase
MGSQASPRRRPGLRGWLAAGLLALGTAASASETPLNRALGEQVVFIRHSMGVELETTVFRPDGPGPFPLVIVNHGKSPGDPKFQPRARYLVAARELVRRGYAVAIPMRGGFSRSGGFYVDGGCNIEGNARQQASYLRSAVDWLAQQSWVDPRRMVLMGQSHGGLSALALASEPRVGVLGVINFAGGLRHTGGACQYWEAELVAAFGRFGRTTALPTLWFYGANDSYFAPPLVQRMHAAYTASGGAAKLVAYGPFKDDAHGTFGDRQGLVVWWPETEAFLAALGLPVALQPRATPADPALAALEDLSRLPNLSPGCAGVYASFLDADQPRAYAHSAKGACGYAFGVENVAQRALAFCQRRGGESCRLYAVDERIVWNPKAD